MSKLTMAVLFGGVSTEHDISLISASSILPHLSPEKYTLYPIGITKEGRWLLYEGGDFSALPEHRWLEGPCVPAAISPDRGVHGLQIFRPEGVQTVRLDCVFPVLHGAGGEDGTIQGLLELSGIPYVGCGVAASACGMDKSITKRIVAATGVPQAASVLVRRRDFERDEGGQCRAVMERLGEFPVFIKPCSSGSSVGVHKARDLSQLRQGLADALRYDPKVIVEEFVGGQEIEVAVLGNADALLCTRAGEIVAGEEFYTFEAKYQQGVSQLYIPARIPAQSMETVRQFAAAVYQALDGRGLARVDFFCRGDGSVIFNEINTLPGFTATSMYPKLMDLEGIAFEPLLDQLVALALEGEGHG